MILDSGKRREFESGAVRDMAEGRGRCDLAPLDVIAEYMNDSVIACVSEFMENKDERYLIYALYSFREKRCWDDSTMILEVAKHYEEGTKKYGERNWEKGIPIHCFIDSGVRHYLKWKRGDNDEPHDRAFVWNILGALWTLKHKPELDDIPMLGNNRVAAESIKKSNSAGAEKGTATS